MGGLCPLFFDGAVCEFEELPLPNNTKGIERVYKYLDRIRGAKPSTSMFMFNNVKKRFKWLTLS